MSNELSLIKSVTPQPTHKEKAIASAYIAQARQRYTRSTSDFEIDDEPQVSIAKDGAWVAAWVWVTQEEAGLSKERRTRSANI